MAKGESQKRLSLSTIEKSALLFMAQCPQAKDIPDFVWFLEAVNDEGLPAVREKLLKALLTPTPKGLDKRV